MRSPTRGAEIPLLAAALVVAVATTLASPQNAPSTRFALEEATVADLEQRMAFGSTSSRALVEQYLARIEAVDRSGPQLRSIIEVNPDAIAFATQMDRERADGHVRGPLHGIPVVIKDNIATGDRMKTSAGSLALASSPAPRDAFLVTRLREAGAVLIGKTNLSEWANFRSTHSSSGWSGRGGQVRNPYALDRNPSGSSSGTGAAVAANLAAIGVGTETDGSIVSPSNVNGLVGIKPTLGLVSRTGIVPIAHSQDTAGPMTRTVADAAALLTVLAAPDSADSATGVATRVQADYTKALDPDGLRGARIGVVRNRLFGYNPAADALANAAIQAMKARGAVIIDPANIPSLGQFDDSEFEVLLYEARADLPRFFDWWGPTAPVHNLNEIIAFNNAHASDELRYFGQEILEMAAKKGALTDAAYRNALAKNRRLAGPEGIDLVMRTNRLDALVAPTGGPAWLIDLVNGDGGTASAPGPSTVTSVAGYPHITVPMGFDHGLPIGISFFGKAWGEATLIKLAYSYEQATHHRKPPAFAPTADLAR